MNLYCPAGRCNCKFFVDLKPIWACSFIKVYNESFDVCPWPLRKELTEEIELKTIKKYNLSPKDPTKPIESKDDYLSLSEAAIFLKRKRDYLYNMTSKNKIKFYKPGS